MVTTKVAFAPDQASSLKLRIEVIVATSYLNGTVSLSFRSVPQPSLSRHTMVDASI